MTTADPREYELDDPDEYDETAGCSVDGAELDAAGTCPFGHTAADQAAADAWNDAETARHDAECGTTYLAGPAHDPSVTTCDQAPGHYPAARHEGDSPFGGGGRVRWNGGGACAGDRLPVSGVEYILPDPAPGSQGTCLYCDLAGPVSLFAPFNPAGNLACLDVKGCALRQAVAAGHGPELDALTARVRAGCAHVAGDPACACRYRLAELIGPAFGLDPVSAVLLAAGAWEAALS